MGNKRWCSLAQAHKLVYRIQLRTNKIDPRDQCLKYTAATALYYQQPVLSFTITQLQNCLFFCIHNSNGTGYRFLRRRNASSAVSCWSHLCLTSKTVVYLCLHVLSDRNHLSLSLLEKYKCKLSLLFFQRRKKKNTHRSCLHYLGQFRTFFLYTLP